VNDDADDADDADDLAALHDNLASTAELPVERSASRWLGEAEALAADLRESDLPDDVVADRLATIEKLLRQVEETGDQRADEHVAAARERLADARARYD
jgi:regulator of protease activity HflC (stomatin/prohibitin superfamily)